MIRKWNKRTYIWVIVISIENGYRQALSILWEKNVGLNFLVRLWNFWQKMKWPNWKGGVSPQFGVKSVAHLWGLQHGFHKNEKMRSLKEKTAAAVVQRKIRARQFQNKRGIHQDPSPGISRTKTWDMGSTVYFSSLLHKHTSSLHVVK